ncbi:hypothetical protein EVA_06053, partial [gut metagenome]
MRIARLNLKEAEDRWFNLSSALHLSLQTHIGIEDIQRTMR